MTEDDLVEVCPGCDTAGCFSNRTRKDHPDMTGDPDATYRCSRCGETFDEPRTRERRGDPPSARRVSDEQLDAVREKMGIGVDG